MNAGFSPPTSPERNYFMPKKSVEESRDLVEDARARINAQKEAARELAEAEAVVAQADAEEAARARKELLDGCLAQYHDALAVYEEKRDAAVKAALDYAPFVIEADKARSQIEQFYSLIAQHIRPQGFLANKAEQDYEDAISHAPTVGIEQAGEAREIHRLELGLSHEEMDALQAVLNHHIF
jgi:hypothetical protein